MITTTKPAYLSKTFWGAVVSIVGGIGAVVAGESVDVKIAGVSSILGGLGAIFGRRNATAPISLSMQSKTRDV